MIVEAEILHVQLAVVGCLGLALTTASEVQTTATFQKRMSQNSGRCGP